MGKNKEIRKRIRGEEKRLAEHEAKIQKELSKPSPDFDRIAHWEAEARGWRASISRKKARLKRMNPYEK